MVNKASEAELLSLIQTALEIDPGSLTAESSTENTDGWDSLGHINILIALDSRFDGKVAPIKEMATASSVKKITELLKQHALLG